LDSISQTQNLKKIRTIQLGLNP